MRRQTSAAGILFVVLVRAFLIVFAVSALFPPVWMFYNSVKTSAEFARDIVGVPIHPTLVNYSNIFGGPAVYRSLFNSVFNSVLSTAGVVVISFMLAYFLARYRFPGRNVFYAFFLFGLLVPVYGLMIPVFIQFRDIGLLDTRFSLLLPYIAFGLSQAMFLTEGFIHSVPSDLEEAAFIDGASLAQVLTHVVLPVCTPIIVTVAILNFLNTWNEFGFALVLLSGDRYKTIPLWLNTFQGERTVNYTALMAALTVASVPVIAVYLAFREKIISGFVSGALKG